MINFYDVEEALSYLIAHGVEEFEVDKLQISVVVSPRIMVALFGSNAANKIIIRKEGQLYYAYATVNNIEYSSRIGLECEYEKFKKIYGEFKEEGIDNAAAD